MAYFEIEGGQTLSGTVKIPGAKNAALKMFCAALLTTEKCILTNVPDISDLRILAGIFKKIGVNVDWDTDKKIVEITAKNLDPKKLKDCEEVKQFRASLLMMGPLLARCGECELLKPGGCVLGARPNTIHIDGFNTLGADVFENDEKISGTWKRQKFKNKKLLLPEASVTGTENLSIFAAGIEDEVEIFFVASEPIVGGTHQMLQGMGAEIEGIGTHHIKIKGKQWTALKGGTFEVPPDGIIAGTYAISAILTGGEMLIENVDHFELYSFYGLLKRAGVNFEMEGQNLRILPTKKLIAIPKIQTAIFPGFASDLQSPMGLLATQCEGETMIFETLYEGRLTYLNELEKMGANIRLLNAHQAIIRGRTPLKGQEVQSWDLRAGATVVLAGLIAEGTTKVTNIQYIDRGYEYFVETLQELGAKIKRINV